MSCGLPTETQARLEYLLWNSGELQWNWTGKACKALHGLAYGTGCDTVHYVPDVFFFSCLLFFFTFALAMSLKSFRNTRFFPNQVCDLC